MGLAVFSGQQDELDAVARENVGAVVDVMASELCSSNADRGAR